MYLYTNSCRFRQKEIKFKFLENLSERSERFFYLIHKTRMKRTILIFFLSFCYIVFSEAQTLIRIQGSVSENGVALKEVNIKIYKSKGGVFRRTKTDTSGNYHFDLSLGTSEEYLIVVSKRGFVSKRYLVSTENIPAAIRNTSFPPIGAYVTLFKPIRGIDYSLLLQPLIKYYYDAEKDRYAYDKVLLEEKLKELEKIKEQEKLKLTQ
jgi:hypothetical protein